MRNLFVTLRFFLLGWGCLGNSPSLVGADDASRADAAQLEDLGAELLKPSPAAPLEHRLLESPSEAGDKRQSAPNEPLSEVIGHMQTAQTLLERSDDSGSAASTAQGAALTGLDAMIAALTRRQSLCQGGQQSSDKSGQPSPSKPGSNGSAGSSPAQAAASSTQSGADLSTARAATGKLVKDLWGQLPERQRQQILQPLGEEFLPKYASEIEAYFRALADPNRTTPGLQ